MGVVMVAYGIDEPMLRRIDPAPQPQRGFLGRLFGGPEPIPDDDEDLIEAIDDQFESYSPPQGDGKSWDVMHYALTGHGAGKPTDFFGTRALQRLDLGNWAGVLDPAATAALASELEQVDEATMRARLHDTPKDLYWADTFGRPDEHGFVLEDAWEFVAYVRRCADAGLALLITLA